MSVNKVILIGRLGRDPELKYTPSGAAVCAFSLAVTENWRDKQGNKQERTEWVNVEVWGKLAEICNQYLAKGRQAYVEGKLKTDVSEKDGQKRYFTKVSALNVQFLGGPNANAEQPGASQGASNSAPQEDYNISMDSNFTSDDIPF